MPFSAALYYGRLDRLALKETSAMGRSSLSITRGQFLRGSLALAGLSLLPACSGEPLPWQKPTTVAKIGILLPYGENDPESTAMVEPLRAGLRELGYLEGQTTILESRFADGQRERLPALAAELTALPVDVIVADKEDALVAATHATGTIPIVISTHSDPIGSGFLGSLSRPGGNVTGVLTGNLELARKHPELLLQVSPGISRIAIFSDHGYSPTQRMVEQAELSTRALGLELLPLHVRGPEDFQPAFDAALRAGVNALQVFNDPLSTGQRGRILDFAAQHRLGAIYQHKQWVINGGLMSYGANQPALYRRAAYFVDRILKGAKPADLPVELPTLFDLSVNLKTAQSQGIVIPADLMQQAVDIIQ
jgi:putative ABC transport system substrate-binding protein